MKMSQYPVATDLEGSDIVLIAQGGITLRTTLADIASITVDNDQFARLAAANTFEQKQTIDLGSGALPAGIGSVSINLLPVNGNSGRLNAVSIANSNGSLFSIYVMDGTRASPTNIKNGYGGFTFSVQGYSGSAFHSGGTFGAVIDGDWVEGVNYGTYWDWKGTSNGSTTIISWMTLRNGTLALTGGVASTSTTTGTEVITGGLGVSGDQFIGGKIVSVNPTAGVGYATGAGGTVTQATSKATGVTLNKVSGEIVLNAANLAAATSVSFVLTNSAIAATDALTVNIKSGATLGSYLTQVDAVAAGSCTITLRNYSGGALAEAVVLTFNLHKGVAA